MYKVASDQRQERLHRGRPNDWLNGSETLTIAERLRQMADGVKIMRVRLRGATTPDEQRQLTIKLDAMNSELIAFRRKHGLPDIHYNPKIELPYFFMCCAAQALPPAQFERIKNAAKVKLAEYHAPERDI